jgi:uncharacterized OB-fold protein
MSQAQAGAVRVPIEAGFFTIPEDPALAPKLLASRCSRCGEVYFPRRVSCIRCYARELTPVEIGPRGTLYTFTYVHVPMFGTSQRDSKGYGVGQVDLPEGPRVQAVLSGRREDFRIGMEMELELETLRETPEGERVVIMRFRPVDAARLAG